MNILNIKLNINLTGNEAIINLNNKNIGNIELDFFCSVEFSNLEELDLSHNNLSDIKPLKNFKNLKIINLSYNKIKDISSLKEISENNKGIEKINLSNNSINEVEILKKDIFANIIEINLDNNNLIKKDIEEIKDIIKKINDSKFLNWEIKYSSNNSFEIGFKFNYNTVFVTCQGNDQVWDVICKAMHKLGLEPEDKRKKYLFLYDIIRRINVRKTIIEEHLINRDIIKIIALNDFGLVEI